MKTREEIQAEADKVDELLNRPVIPMYEQTALEAMQQALQWALGVYTETPTSTLE